MNEILQSISGEGLINAMKSALGDVLEPAALQAMEVSKAMAAAGASKEEIEEMMAVILNRGGTVSQEFLEAIKEVMESGGNIKQIQKAKLGRNRYSKKSFELSYNSYNS